MTVMIVGGSEYHMAIIDCLNNLASTNDYSFNAESLPVAKSIPYEAPELFITKTYVNTPEDIKVIPVDQIRTRKPIRSKSKMIHQFGPVQLKR